jgi:hypothetical protein
VNPTDEYRLALDQSNKLADRRQTITATYLSVNAAITGAVAFLFKDGRLPDISSQVTVLALLLSGVVACGLWRRIIKHYSTQMGWWFEQIRSMESQLPDGSNKLFTKEYQELYFKQSGKKDSRITPYEINLTWLFTTIYVVFGMAILVAIILRFV